MVITEGSPARRGLRDRQCRRCDGAVTLEPEPGHAGGGTGFCQKDFPRTDRGAQAAEEETFMTIQSKTAARPSSVTTGPIAGSRKIHVSPEGRPDILVPFREIELDPTAREAPYHAYDTSGPYTDPSVTIDLSAGLRGKHGSCESQRSGPW